MLGWLDDLLLPVVIESHGPGNRLFEEKFHGRRMILWKNGDKGFGIPWPWFPRNVTVYGIGRERENVHIWFVGQPKGQEEMSWRDLILAVGRKQKILTPIAEQMAEEIAKPLAIAVFTTAG